MNVMPKMSFTSSQMLEKLIGFDTVSHKSNLGLMAFVQEYLEGYGIASTLIHDETGKKANLHACLGDASQPGVILSGHTDVVPVEGQAWDSDPFTLMDKGDNLYGRGTCDMKGFIAVVLSKVPEFVEADLKLPLHFAFSYDEELGCLGAHDLVDFIDALEVKPKLCVVGEPTMMKLITGHKGVCDFECHVQGKECHSSLAPYGVNAVEYAAEMVAFIKKIARRQQTEGPFNNNFHPPFTTVHTGMFSGGTAINIVPNKCRVDFEIRAVPEQNPDEILEEIKQFAWKTLEPAMKDIDPATGFKFKEIANAPSFDISNEHEAVSLMRTLSGANSVEKVSFATEAGIFQSKDIPTVVCGPGNIEQAHRPNEFVSKDQMLLCEKFIDRLIEHVS